MVAIIIIIIIIIIPNPHPGQSAEEKFMLPIIC